MATDTQTNQDNRPEAGKRDDEGRAPDTPREWAEFRLPAWMTRPPADKPAPVSGYF